MRAKAFHALYRAASVTGSSNNIKVKKTEEDQMGWTCSMRESYEKFIQNYSKNTKEKGHL
jgi:hypothetical protein